MSKEVQQFVWCIFESGEANKNVMSDLRSVFQDAVDASPHEMIECNSIRHLEKKYTQSGRLYRQLRGERKLPSLTKRLNNQESKIIYPFFRQQVHKSY